MRRLVSAGLILISWIHSGHSAELGREAAAALSDLNSAFLNAHAKANRIDLAAGGPVILLRDGQLVLRRDQTESTAQVVLPESQTLKAFAHMPLAIYLMLDPPGSGEFDQDRQSQLRSYLTKMERVERRLEQIGLEGASLERQKDILSISKQFAEQVLSKRRYSADELHAFARRMTPMIMANVAGAAASQLNAMHRQVMAWKGEMNPKEWAQLRVAVKGAVLARNGNLAKQYFERLLGAKGEGMRLVYMERYTPKTPMLNLLATRSIDGKTSAAFFGDPDRMFRDVFADAAAAHIKTMQFE
jgi:hypothetical protein